MQAEHFLTTERTYSGLSGNDHALLYGIFRFLWEANFPDKLRIDKRQLSRLTGLSLRTVERARERLGKYRVDDDWLLCYKDGYYSLNYAIYERQNGANGIEGSLGWRQDDAINERQNDVERQIDAGGSDGSIDMRQNDASDRRHDDVVRQIDAGNVDGGVVKRQNDASKRRQNDVVIGKRQIDVKPSRHFDTSCFSEDEYPIVADNWRHICDFGKRQNDVERQIGVASERQIDATDNGGMVVKRQIDAKRHGDVVNERQIDVERQNDASMVVASDTSRSLATTSVVANERQIDANFPGNIYNNNNIYLEEEEEFKNLKYSSSSFSKLNSNITGDIDLEEEKEKEKIKKEKEREEFLKNLPEMRSKGPDPVDNETKIDALLRYWYYELPLKDRKSYSKLAIMLIERFDRDYFIRNKCGVLNDIKRMMLVRIGIEYSFDADRVVKVVAKIATTTKNPIYIIPFVHNELFPEDKIEV